MGNHVWILAAVIIGALLMLAGIAAGVRLAKGLPVLPAVSLGRKRPEKPQVPEELQWALGTAEKLGIEEDLSPEAQEMIRHVRGERPRPP